MKTIADFKRAMILGSTWECTHRYIGNNPSKPKNRGVRECGLHNSVDFGFKTEQGISHCAWPKKSTFSMDGHTVVITQAGFCELRYTLWTGKTK